MGTEKSNSLTPGAVARGLEGNDDIVCRANGVSIEVDSEYYFYSKKKFEISTEKKRGKQKGREKMNVKKKEKKGTLTKTTR